MRTKIKTLADQYQRSAEWSEEDNCYVGSIPDLCDRCCHGDTQAEVYQQLDEIAQSWIEEILHAGETPPEAKTIAYTPKNARNTFSKNKVSELRHQYKLSQEAFAKHLGITPKTLRNWEQGTCSPSGAAARLLQITKDHPEIIIPQPTHSLTKA